MSYTYLLEQGEESSAECLSDIPASVLSRLSLTHERSCSNDNATGSCRGSRSGTTSAPLTENRGEDTLMSSAEDSRARTSVPPEKERDSAESEVGYGLRWPASSARFDRVTCSWKIHPCLFPEDSISCSVTLPRWGTMRSGVLSAQTMPALRTGGSGSGLWQTPVSDDAVNRKAGKFNSRGEPKLIAQVLWPTPTVAEANKIPAQANYGQVGLNNHPRIRGLPVREKLQKDRAGFDGGTSTRLTYPTPTKSDGMGGPGTTPKRTGGENLRTNVGGQLNPSWVEWLMGWPIGWTDLKPLEMDRFARWRRLHGEYSQED